MPSKTHVTTTINSFATCSGSVRGRLYYNLANWYRMLALLPSYRTNRRFMEQMMGVREPLPEEIAADIDRRSLGGRLADLAHLVSTVAGLVANHFTLNGRVQAFYQRLNEALVEPDPPLAERRPDELVEHYRELRRRLLLRWDAPLVNDFFAMLIYGLLRRLTQSWCQDQHGTLQNDLVGGKAGWLLACTRISSTLLWTERLINSAKRRA